MTHRFKLLTSAALFAFAMGMNIPLALANDAPQVAIAPQPLGDALQEWAVRNRKQLIFDAGLTAGKQTRGAAGLNGIEALSRLLDGTGLSYRVLNERTISILPVAEAVKERAKAGVELTAQPMRLAQRVEEKASDTAAASNSGESTEASGTKGIPEMLVKGARTSNIDIQRTEDDVQPYVVFTAEDIEHSMAGSLDQFLMSRLPMNTSRYAANVPSTLPLNGNISSIDLRGLGANQTLILVNGRRVPGVGTTTTLSQSDINGIPMSSVARIEVLPSTAGGIYGGGATGGVINIILKDDYKGVEINARYDGTFRQDAANRVLEASAGFSLEGGRTSVMLSASRQRSERLLEGDRDFIARRRAQLALNNPAVYGYTGTTIPLGNTSNIRSVNGSNLILASTGQNLGFANTHVPYGYAGPQSDNAAALVANAGRYNMDISSGPNGERLSLTGEPAIDSLRLNVRRRFTDRIEAFVDASQSGSDSSYDFGNSPWNMTNIPANSPNNPFTTPINVAFAGNDYTDGDLVATSNSLNITGGLIFRLPRNWTVQGEYGRGESDSDYLISQLAAYGIFEPLGRSGVISILRDVSVYPNDYSPYRGPVGYTGDQPDPQGANMTNMTLRAAGPTFALPAGPVMLSALLEQRVDEVDGSVSASVNPSFAVTYRYTPPRKQTTQGAYAELTAPLISAANALPFARALDLQVSYRRDRIGSRTVATTSQGSFVVPSLEGPFPDPEYFTNHVEANQYTVGLRYQPIESLALRVSNSVGVLPPSLSQLVPNVRFNVSIGSATRDPKRGNVGSTTPVAEVHSTGNPDLRPEQSDSWSAGAIFTPAGMPGFRFSVDYTLIEKTDEISSLSAQVVLDNEATYADRITRLPLTDTDLAQNFTGGRIAYINYGPANLAFTKVEAFDFRLDYRWNTRYGAFRADAAATHQTHLQKQLLTDSPVVEYMGFNDGPLEWRGNTGITWDRGAWSLGWNMQYYDSYPVYSTTSTLTARNTARLNQGSWFIPHQIYHDLSFKYRIDDAPRWGGLFANSQVLVGISNVFDTEPPLILYLTGSGFTTARYGDPRLRRYSISLRKNFR